MALQEFLKSNPEAKAEYEKNLQSAEASGIEKGKAENVLTAINTERKRIVDIIKAAAIDVPATLIEALDSGMDIKDYAVSELARQKEARASKPEKVFSAELKPKQTPGDQDPEASGKAKKTAEEIEAAARKMAEEIKNNMGGI